MPSRGRHAGSTPSRRDPVIGAPFRGGKRSGDFGAGSDARPVLLLARLSPGNRYMRLRVPISKRDLTRLLPGEIDGSTVPRTVDPRPGGRPRQWDPALPTPRSADAGLNPGAPCAAATRLRGPDLDTARNPKRNHAQKHDLAPVCSVQLANRCGKYFSRLSLPSTSQPTLDYIKR